MATGLVEAQHGRLAVGRRRHRRSHGVPRPARPQRVQLAVQIVGEVLEVDALQLGAPLGRLMPRPGFQSLSSKAGTL